MGKFGWAHITDAHKSARGPDGAIQFASGSEGFQSGSNNLTFDYTSDFLVLSGNMDISGTLRANVFDVITTTKTEMDISGSTNFGDDKDDTHAFTGSVSVVSGGLRTNYYKLTAASYNVATHDSIIGVSSSVYTSILIPSASVVGAGRTLIIKDEFNTTRTDATQIAISASTGETIDHNSTYSLSGDSPALSIYSDGISKWFIY